MSVVNGTALTEVSMEGAGMVCYAPMMITSKGAWLGDNPLHFSVPLFLLQLIVIISTSRLLHILLKPFRQPRAISEILCGIILGPSVLGRSTMFLSTVFPLRSLVVFDTMANIGLVYNFFLVGVEMDLLLAFRLEKRVVAIAFVGMILPFAVSCSCSYVLGEGISPMMDQGTYIVFVALAMSISAFPLLSRILVELKILHLEIGRLAMASSFINDVLSWIILVMIIVLAENKTVDANHIWVILSSAAFVLFCILFIRPAIWFLIKKTPEGESYSETSICLILTGVMISGYITEAIGTHAIVGAFVFGLVIPNGPLATILIEKLEDFVTGILLPLYYASSGLKSKSNDDGCYHFALILVTILACAAKVIGTLLTAMFYKMPLREAATLGFLMNAKGLTEMVALNLGFEHEILDGTAYAIMVFASAIMIGITIPIVTIIYKPARKPVTYRGRAIDRATLESELRILVAIHTSRNVPIIINLLEASSGSVECPLSVYVLHLAELTGRASAMLNVSATQEAGAPAINKTHAQSDHIIKEFSSLEQQKARISVQHLAAISPYSSMHEDICILAETKQVAFIIIPFHQQQTVDGEMTSINPDLQKVNQNVLENAVCSVGILIDRGLSGYTHSVDGQLSHHIGVLFFGGPDDREVLAYAMRLAQHPSSRITVIRFLPGKEAVTSIPELKRGQRHSRMPSQIDKDIQLDDEYIQNFRTAEANNVKSLIYAEKMINNSEETVAAVKSLDSIYDLFMVGRRQGTLSILTEGLTDWSETPELGAIGDLLVSPDFPARVSILVVQHFIR